MTLARVCALVPCLLLAAAAAAQEPYPTRPVALVVPFPPGGVADLTARPVATALEKVLKAAMDKLETPIVFKQGDEFRSFFEADASRLAEGVRRVGKVETQ